MDRALKKDLDAASHTPGPWTFGYERKRGRISDKNVLLIMRGSEEICEIPAWMTHDRIEPNAHLIASAPALLEALVAIHNMLGWLSAESFYEIPDKVIDQMTAAIALAKGKQP